MSNQKRRAIILATIDDLVTDFLYYDRKEDPALPKGAIEAAVKDNVVTVEEMIEKFATTLRHGLANE